MEVEKQRESVVSLPFNIQDILDLLRFFATVLGWNGGGGRISVERAAGSG